MTILSSNSTTYHQLPPLKLPSLFQNEHEEVEGDFWSTNNSNTINTSHVLYGNNNTAALVSGGGGYDYYQYQHNKMSTTDILLPPILTTNNNSVTASPPPLSPPYSTCSTSSSSFPSSPNSSSVSSFTISNKKGSIQSLLNSGSELLALEKQQLVNGYYSHCDNEEKSNSRNSKKRPFNMVMTSSINKKQKTDTRQIKGLRLFSKQVCDKVAEKRTTTYNEVADELAADIQRHHLNSTIDGKNIRRRVYDALNVLMALDIITKDRKEIKWIGIVGTPGGDHRHQQQQHQQQQLLEKEIQFEESRQKELLESIQKNKSMCYDTSNHLDRLKYLVKRNHYQSNVTVQQQQLPFLLIQGKDMVVDFNHGHEACLSSTTTTIYKDVDILAKIWPQPPSSTVTTVS